MKSLIQRASLVTLVATAIFQNACQTVDSEAPARASMNAAIRAEAPGDYFIGRRMYKSDYKMWGWVREPGKSWTAGKLGGDNNYEYRLSGRFSGETVYEPASDRFYPEFVLTGYELLNTKPTGIYITNRQEDPDIRIIMAPVH
jgi:hypothetical protein